MPVSHHISHSAKPMNDMEPRVITVGIVAPAGSQALDIVGPVDAFAQAGKIPDNPVRYAISLLGTAPGPITASSGLRLMPDRLIGETNELFDTLLVAGSPDIEALSLETAAAAWLADMAPVTRRIASICNGAFLLGAAGLLMGRRATTHWQSADTLANRFPDTRVEHDRTFVRDGHIYSSAGVTAGIDLALALIEQDCGPTVSLAVAHALAVCLRRPGGQSQFSMHLWAQLSESSPLGALSDFVLDNLSADLSVERLARQASMSRRSLTRLFHEALKTTPARFVEAARVEAARSLLEAGSLSIQQVSHHCGFGSIDTMRRAFIRHLTVSPAGYRQRFQAPSHAAPGPLSAGRSKHLAQQGGKR
ncbi:transcriptional regulator GlxA family with amidase domain [Methylorubrum rhodinum]|uniref:Transcriptional regulator GlxA family with amidase domain n=1 Tax=Methylorubrum rhodinum TaxID=29428 RepID=A0A840ZHM2_9HYPH|nr:DJ-1/PfpI family protein [Methylorubrum rhodinum]MBB5756477.1 transcriptional regulator GlxA family with amidase domain [Methylorubrum rhodinum]